MLYIDEINLLRLHEALEALLTAMQERAFDQRSVRAIQRALTKTEAVPCDFVLIAAGNLDAIQRDAPRPSIPDPWVWIRSVRQQ